MATTEKMFIHWSSGKTAFATSANETKYYNSIVFIKATATEGECIYTHGTYFASIKELTDALNSLKYISKVAVDGSVYSAGSKDSTISFKTTDPQTITIDVEGGELVFGLDDTFVKRVNDTSTNADALRADLGTSTDTADKATAFGRIADLEAIIEALTGGEGGESINDMIDGAIETITGNLVDGDASTFEAINDELDAHDASIKGLDTSVNALIAKDASLDASVNALIAKDASLDEQIGELIAKDASFDASVKALDASVKVLIAKDASLDASVNALIAKDASLDEQIGELIAKDASLDASVKELADNKADLKDGKILASQLPDYILGQVLFGGTIDANGTVTASENYKAKYSDTTSIPDASACEGAYFIATGDGTVYGVEYKTGDWVISNGTNWVKIDNTDAVSSVAGLAGAVTADGLAKELSKDFTGALATRAELEEMTGDIKVTAEGDSDLIDASAGDGRTITVSASERLSAAVERAEDAVLEVKGTENEIVVTDGDTVTVALDASVRTALGKANSAVQTVTGTADFVEVAVSGTERTIDLSDAVKTSLSRADDAVLEVKGTANEIVVTDGDTVTVALDASVRTALGKANSALQSISASGEGYVDASVANGNEVNVKLTIADVNAESPNGLVDYDGLMAKFGWEEL